MKKLFALSCYQTMVNFQKKDPLSIAIKIMGREFGSLEFSDMDDIIISLSNYFGFLSKQVGEITARIIIFEDRLDLTVAPKASRYGASHARERRAIVIASHEDIGKLNNQLIEEKVKLEILKPICESIKMKVYSLNRIYERRVKEAAIVFRGS